MRIVSGEVIDRFVRKHLDAKSWLDDWQRTAEELDWSSIQEVREWYPAVDGGVKVASGGTVTIFNVGGNKYRMVCSILYPSLTIIVHQLMSHAEYSKDLWKDRY
jgi:mRNA interferase HigB